MVHYQGLANNKAQLFTLFVLSNLWKVCNCYLKRLCHLFVLMKFWRRAASQALARVSREDAEALLAEGGNTFRRGRRYLSGRTLSLAQEWQLRSIIVGENPKQLSLPFALWNRRAVMQLIKVLFDIEMPIRTVGEYLLRWGYTPRRPMKRALEQNPVKVEQWLNDTHPTIAARAKAEASVIYWGDETAVAEDGHWLRGYAPAGQTPLLAAPSKRHGLSMVSAISNQGLVRFEFIEEAMNTDLFIGCMGRLIADSSQKVFLILDNLKVHHAKLVTAWLAERKDQLEVFYLPPYSPEINPDEYLNRDFKTELRSSDRATSKKALLQKATRFMAFLSKTPERVMAYFNHAAVQYAAFSDI